MSDERHVMCDDERRVLNNVINLYRATTVPTVYSNSETLVHHTPPMIVT